MKYEKSTKATMMLQRAAKCIGKMTPDAVVASHLGSAMSRRRIRVNAPAILRRTGNYRGGMALKGGRAPHTIGKNIAQRRAPATKHGR